MLCSFICVTGQAKPNFRDFSAQYPNLAGLRLASSDVTDSGTGSVEIFGVDYTASKYSLTTEVTVQTLCAVGGVSNQVYEKVPAKFEILVAEDKDKAVRNRLIEAIYTNWNKKELYSGEYFFDFTSKGSQYALTAMPDLVNVKGYYFVWLNGRIVKIVFRGLEKDSGGWGAMDSFTAEILRIELGGSLFKAYSFPLSPRKTFLKSYKSNLFF